MIFLRSRSTHGLLNGNASRRHGPAKYSMTNRTILGAVWILNHTIRGASQCLTRGPQLSIVPGEEYDTISREASYRMNLRANQICTRLLRYNSLG